MSKTKTIFDFEESELAFCCGLNEIGNMKALELTWGTDFYGQRGWLLEDEYMYRGSSDDNGESYKNTSGMACIAVTEPSQKKEEKELDKRGFRVIGTWTGRSHTRLKLWFKKPKGQRWNTPKKRKLTARKAK